MKNKNNWIAFADQLPTTKEGEQVNILFGHPKWAVWVNGMYTHWSVDPLKERLCEYRHDIDKMIIWKSMMPTHWMYAPEKPNAINTKVDKPCFTLKHVALYAKHHYERSENIWEDIKACLRADDYNPETKTDVIGIIFPRVIKLIEENSSIELYHQMSDFIHNISPRGCERIGYFTKDTSYPFADEKHPTNTYDFYEAILRFCLSDLLGREVVQLGGLPPASEKVLPLRTKF